MFHSAVCELSSDQYVQDCRNTEKPCQSPDYSLAIGLLENQGLLQAPFSKIDANRDQYQSSEEDDCEFLRQDLFLTRRRLAQHIGSCESF